MKAVAAAYQARSLQAFQDTLAAHRPQLVDDAFVNAHLTVHSSPYRRKFCLSTHAEDIWLTAWS